VKEIQHTRTKFVASIRKSAMLINIANGWVLLHFVDTNPIQSVQVIRVNGPNEATVDMEMENGVNFLDHGKDGRFSAAKLDGESAKLIACFRSSITRLHIIPALERILAAIGATLR